MPPPPSSKAWAFFKRNTDSKIKCKLCECELVYTGGTSNMFNHLKLKHSSERIFSCARLVVSKLRNRLSSSLVDQIIFLSKNYVPEQKTDDWFKYQIVFFCMFSCVIGVGIDKWLTCVCYVYKCTWNLVIILLSVIDLLPMYDRKSFYTTS